MGERASADKLGEGGEKKEKNSLSVVVDSQAAFYAGRGSFQTEAGETGKEPSGSRLYKRRAKVILHVRTPGTRGRGHGVVVAVWEESSSN